MGDLATGLYRSIGAVARVTCREPGIRRSQLRASKAILHKVALLLIAVLSGGLIAALAVAACGSNGGDESGEHGGDEAGKGGEESGTRFALDETYDEIRVGARLILSLDAQANTFTGTVENTTSNVLSQVRVEVHLSNGVELGPTTPIDLALGQVADVTLPVTNASFDSWSAHPEVG